MHKLIIKQQCEASENDAGPVSMHAFITLCGRPALYTRIIWRNYLSPESCRILMETHGSRGLGGAHAKCIHNNPSSVDLPSGQGLSMANWLQISLSDTLTHVKQVSAESKHKREPVSRAKLNSRVTRISAFHVLLLIRQQNCKPVALLLRANSDWIKY
jgi:hypothetical protein